MEILYYIGIAIFFMISGYFFAKKILFFRNDLVRTSAEIDHISIVPIGDLWSPELLVNYFFYYDGQRYEGKDYIRIDRFIGSQYVYLSDQNGFPLLVTPMQDFIGEEHIETYLLEYRKGVPIEFNTASLPYSRIYSIERHKDTMFQDIEIDFPWTR